MNIIGKKLSLVSLTFVACASIVSAQPGTAFHDGDLILGFQAASGDGSTKNVFFNLGSPIGYRNGTIPASLGNIGGTLSDAFGSDWFDREDVRFGVIANLNDFDPGGFLPPAPVNGDPTATLYVSQPAGTPGTGALLTFQAGSELAFGGTKVSGLEGTVYSLSIQPDGSFVLDQTVQQTQWNTGWTIYNPASPSPSFGIFSNIEQHLGQGGSNAHVDIQRILPTSNGASPSGPVLTGEYIFTLSIDSTGNITASKAGGNPTSNFTSWASANGVTGGANGDSDFDGILNLVEYALDLNHQGSDGSPGTYSGGVISFTKRPVAVSNGDITYVIETSDDLGVTSPWTPVTSGVTNNTTQIFYTLPSGKPKSFARLRVTSAP